MVFTIITYYKLVRRHLHHITILLEVFTIINITSLLEGTSMVFTITTC